jgi:hypothetical protein
MNVRKEQIAVAATAQSICDAVEAVKHFTLRAHSRDARALMASILEHRIRRFSELRDQLRALAPAENRTEKNHAK